MPYGSALPAALAYLVTLWTAEVANQGFTDAGGQVPEVLDGPALPDSSARTAIFVGWHGWAADVAQIDPTGAEIVTQFPPPLGGPDRERWVIHCAAQALNGDGDSGQARSDAFRLRDMALGSVAARRGLGGPPGMQVMAGGAGGSLRQEQTANGALATVEFDVEAEAFTNR